MKNKAQWPQDFALAFVGNLAILGGVGHLIKHETAKGVLIVLFGLAMLVTLCCRIAARVRRRRKEEQLRKELQERYAEEGGDFLTNAFASLEKIEQMCGKDKDGKKEFRPPTFDWDNGECPYPRDKTKPLGSKENPVVVGEPKSSTHLVYDSQRGWWMLTDGLGNGWLR